MEELKKRTGEIIQSLCGYSGERREDINPFCQEITGVTNERKAETAAGYPGFTMDKKQVCRFQ